MLTDGAAGARLEIGRLILDQDVDDDAGNGYTFRPTARATATWAAAATWWKAARSP